MLVELWQDLRFLGHGRLSTCRDFNADVNTVHGRRSTVYGEMDCGL
jgi:hypothetical protein